MNISDLSLNDVRDSSTKFWSMYLDPVHAFDFGCFTILTAHVNLVIGTIAGYLHERPDLWPLVKSLLKFDTVGVYLLREIDHSNDPMGVETTATTCVGGGFILHTPRRAAAKYVHILLHPLCR